MKTTVLISIILLAPAFSWSQQPAQPIAPPPRPVPPIAPSPRPPPPIISDNIIIPGAPATNATETNETETNQFEATNGVTQELTNNMAVTNARTPEMAGALALTNRLSVMAPAQVQAVIQVQSGLGNLQRVAASVSGAPNIQQVIRDNPQVQQQLQIVSAGIMNLARGPDRPSADSVDRLSVDLLRACSHTQMASDEQLALSIVINLIVNCQDLSATQIDSAINNGLIVLRNTGVPSALCRPFGCDLNSIALEIQPNLGI